MRIITSCIVAFSMAFHLNAQVVESDFQKLFDLYIMDKHEDCLFQSLKKMEKDKYRKSPKPYIYAARSSIKLMDNQEYLNEFPLTLKEAIRYGSKYVKYKNKTDNPEDYDLYYAEDIEMLRLKGLDEAEYYYHESKFRKAAYYAKKVYQLAPEDPRNQLLLGLAQLTRRNTREGKANVTEGLNNLSAEPADKDEELLEKELEMIFYLIRACAIELIEMNQNELVQSVLEDVSPILTDKQQEQLESEFDLEIAQG